MGNTRILTAIVLAFIFATLHGHTAGNASEEAILKMLGEDRPYHVISQEVFEGLGWELPDNGLSVKALGDAAPGGEPSDATIVWGHGAADRGAVATGGLMYQIGG